MLRFGTQVEYNKFYDNLRRYALHRALRLFSDLAQREEAVDEAMNVVENELMTRDDIDDIERFSRGVVRNQLKVLSRDRKVDIIPIKERLSLNIDYLFVTETTNFKQVVYKGNYPKVMLAGINDDTERAICLLYWQDGLKQDDIAKINNVSQQYVSQVINKYSK